jgi:hypothetical protein
MTRRASKLGLVLALVAFATAPWPTAGSAATPNTITIAADTPDSDNCWPFGTYLGGGGPWGPHFAFVYKNIPAFTLKPGDAVAFDVGAPNDVDIGVAMSMAPTTANGNDVNAGPFTTVATPQSPASPRGDSIEGNYELAWSVSNSFAFTGGGLLIRFSDPAPAFAADSTCSGALVGAVNSTDPSAFFVARRFQDPDGVSPWTGGDSGPIGQFRISLNPTSNAFTIGTTTRNKKKGTAQIPVTVPGPGTLALTGQGVKAQSAGRSRAETSVASAGTVNLNIRPKGKVKKKLRRRHKAKVRVSITFAPNGDPATNHPAGDPSTQPVKVKLIRR